MNIRDNRGIISIFLTIIMLSMMILSCVFVDGARIITGKEHVERAVNNSVHSTLAAYDKDLKENYGFFGINGENVDENFDKYLNMNLNTEKIEGVDNAFDLYGFEIEDTKVSKMYNFSQKHVTEKAILEHMKYRAPLMAVEFFQELGEAKENIEDAKKVLICQKHDLEVRSLIGDLMEELNELKENIETFNSQKHKLDNEVENIKECVKVQIAIYAITGIKVLIATEKGELKSKKSETNKEEIYQEKKDMEDRINFLSELERRFRDKLEELSKKRMFDKGQINGILRNFSSLEKVGNEIQEECENIKKIFSEIEKESKILEIHLDLVKDKEVKEYYREILDLCKNEIFGSNQKAIEKSIEGIEKVSEKNEDKFEEIEDNLKDLMEEMEEWKKDIKEKVENSKDYMVYFPDTMEGMKEKDDSKKIKDTTLEKYEKFLLVTHFKVNEKINKKILESYDIDEYDSKGIENNFDDLKEKLDDIHSKNEASKADSKKKKKEINDKLKSQEEKIKTLMKKKWEKSISADKSEYPSKNEKATEEIEDIDGDYTIGKGETDSAKKKIDEILNIFSEIETDLTRMPNKLYVNEYAMSTFLSYLNTINKSKDVDVIEVRDLNLEGQTALDLEIEYLLSGLKSDKLNLTTMSGKLGAIRFAFNLMHIIKDKEKRNICKGLGGAMSLATGGVVPPPVFEVLLIISWTGLESYLDIVDLYQGKSVPLMKNDKDWKSSIYGAMDTVKDKVVDSKNKSGTKTIKKKIEFDYYDYLRVLLFIQAKSTTLGRIEDLVQFNMRNIKGDQGYKLENIYTGIDAQVNVSMKYLFMTNGIIPKNLKPEDGKGYLIKGVSVYEGY